MHSTPDTDIPTRPEITIRPAELDDAVLIHRLIKGLAEYERLEDEMVATVEDLEKTLFGPDPGAMVLIAKADSEPVGYALFFYNYSTFLAKRGLYLEDLFVLPDWRGQGIGKRLLQMVGQVAVENDCGRIDWAVLDWNKPAIEFYDSLGAGLAGDWLPYRITGEALKRLGTMTEPGDDSEMMKAE